MRESAENGRESESRQRTGGLRDPEKMGGIDDPAETPGSPAASTRRGFAGPGLSILVATILYGALRASLLHLRFDALAMPNYEIGLMGNLARALQLGGGPPLWAYYDNCGGHLLEGLLAWPLYEAFGPSYMTLKAIPLVLGWSTMLALGSIAVRLSHERARLPAMLLFAFTPPTLVQYSMLAKGNHFEATFYQAILLLGFIRWHQRRGGPRGLFGVGLLAGLSITAYAGSLLLCSLLFGIHLALRHPRRFRGDAKFGAPGILLGLAPLIWIQVRTGGRVARFLTDKFDGHATVFGGHATGGSGFDLALVRDRAHEFGGTLLPASGSFGSVGPLSGATFSWAFLAAWGLAIATLSVVAIRTLLVRDRDWDPRQRAWLSMPMALALPAFAAAYAFTNFDIDVYHEPVEYGTWRYFVPAFALAAPTLAVAHARLGSGGTIARALSWGILGSAGISALPTLALLDRGTPASARAAGHLYDGFHFEHLARVLCRDPLRSPDRSGLRWDRKRIIEEFTDLPPPACFEVARGLGHTFALAQLSSDRDGTPSLDLDALVAGMPEPFHRDLARGAGSFLCRTLHGRPSLLAKTLSESPLLDHPLRAPLVEGLGIPYAFTLKRSVGPFISQVEVIAQGIDAVDHPPLYRGLGIALGEFARRGSDEGTRRIRGLASRLPGPLVIQLYSGVGEGLSTSWRAPRWPAALARHLGDPERRALIEGMARGLVLCHRESSARELVGGSEMKPWERHLLESTCSALSTLATPKPTPD